MKITGRTKVFYCVADPIDQVRAPEVFNEVFARHEVDAAMVPLRVPAARLEATLRTLLDSPSVGGVSLSIPHKAAAASIVDHCSAAATVANAVNAVRKSATGELEGELFDGEGFRLALDRADIAYVNQRVLVVGAGGAASALATALASAGAAEIAVYDLDPTKAEQLANVLRSAFGIRAVSLVDNDPSGFDLVINATPLGLKRNDPLPFDVNAIERHAAVCDILMKNQPTPLLRAASARGLTVEPGFDMLIQQTPLYLEFFGYPELAASVRRNDAYLRDLLFPAEMKESRHLMSLH
jgi:shikimate dehydrogenase